MPTFNDTKVLGDLQVTGEVKVDGGTAIHTENASEELPYATNTDKGAVRIQVSGTTLYI